MIDSVICGLLGTRSHRLDSHAGGGGADAEWFPARWAARRVGSAGRLAKWTRPPERRAWTRESPRPSCTHPENPRAIHARPEAPRTFRAVPPKAPRNEGL